MLAFVVTLMGVVGRHGGAVPIAQHTESVSQTFLGRVRPEPPETWQGTYQMAVLGNAHVFPQLYAFIRFDLRLNGVDKSG